MAVEITGLEEVLGYKTMTRMVQMFPYTPSSLGELFPVQPISGDTAEWDVYKQGRGIAEANVRGGKSKEQALEKVAHKTATCIHLFDNKPLPGDTLNNLRAPGTKEKRARAHIAREGLALRNLHQRTADYYRAAALTGTLTIDQTDVKLTIDYGVSATHKPTATASWGTASTDIVADIKAWMELVRQDSGLEPARAYCNQTVMQYLLNNTKIQKFLGSNAYVVQVGREGKITRLCGLDIHEEDRGYVASGSFTKFVADDKFVITPDPGDWAALQRGTCMVPNDERTDLVEVECPAAYPEVTGDPAAIKLLEHDVVLPVLAIPDSIVYGEVTP